MKTILINIQRTILFLSSAVIFCQNIQISKLDNRNILNSLNLHLAATKLCKNYYSEVDLNKERQNKSSFTPPDKRSKYGCHVCVESIRVPFMSPLESFADRFLKDKRILSNKSNVFALKSIREDLNAKYLEEYNQMVDSVDTEKMVFYQTDLIQGYSFELNELSVTMGTPNASLKGVNLPYILGKGIDSSGYLIRNISGHHSWFQVPMSESKAKKVYDMYANHFHPNPPFRITTKLHYALRLSKEFEGQPRYYMMILKKVEFFLPGEENLKKLQYKVLSETYRPENKIAEVVFDEKLYYAEKGYAFQKLKSVN